MSSMKPERELNIQETLLYLWQHAAIIVVCMLIGAVVSLGLTKVMYWNELPYQASALLYFDTHLEERDSTMDSSQRFEFYSNITNLSSVVVKSEQVLRSVAENLGLDMDADSLAGLVSVESVNSSSFMRLTVRGANREIVKKICEEIVTILPDASAAMTNLGTIQAASQVEVTTTEKANIPKAAVVGALLGLILSILVLVAIELFDHTIHDAGDVAYYLDMPTLGVIPAEGKKIKHTTAVAEAYRSLCTNVDSRLPNQTSCIVVVAGASQGDSGLQETQVLAKALAQLGKKVLIVDADLRRGKLSARLDLADRVGLVELQEQNVPLDAVLEYNKELNCMVLPCGHLSGRSVQAVSAPAAKALFDDLRKRFDVIIVHAVNAAEAADAAILGRLADGVLLVISVGKTNVESALLAKEKMDIVKAPVWGVVLNGYNCKRARRRDGYYYTFSKSCE